MTNHRAWLVERPLLIIPQLWCAMGLNNSIVFRQVYYWTKMNEDTENMRFFSDGAWWVSKPISKWVSQDFPGWSEDTVSRAFSLLRTWGLIVAKKNGNSALWYRIDWDHYDAYMRFWELHGRPVFGQENNKSPFYDQYLEMLEQEKDEATTADCGNPLPQVADMTTADCGNGDVDIPASASQPGQIEKRETKKRLKETKSLPPSGGFGVKVVQKTTPNRGADQVSDDDDDSPSTNPSLLGQYIIQACGYKHLSVSDCNALANWVEYVNPTLKKKEAGSADMLFEQYPDFVLWVDHVVAEAKRTNKSGYKPAKKKVIPAIAQLYQFFAWRTRLDEDAPKQDNGGFAVSSKSVFGI